MGYSAPKTLKLAEIAQLKEVGSNRYQSSGLLGSKLSSRVFPKDRIKSAKASKAKTQLTSTTASQSMGRNPAGLISVGDKSLLSSLLNDPTNA